VFIIAALHCSRAHCFLLFSSVACLRARFGGPALRAGSAKRGSEGHACARTEGLKKERLRQPAISLLLCGVSRRFEVRQSEWTMCGACSRLERLNKEVGGRSEKKIWSLRQNLLFLEAVLCKGAYATGQTQASAVHGCRTSGSLVRPRASSWF